MSAPRQVVLLMTDTQRKDMLGCYGHPDMKTPNLDRLAGQGIRFDRAYTCQPVCAPARAAIFTGCYPHSTGVWANCLPLGDNVKTLGQRVRDQGLHTAYIGKWHLDGGDYFGLGRCPDGWDPDYWYDMRNYLEELSPEDRLRSRRPATNRDPGLTAEFTFAHRCSDRARRFLERHAREDFLLVVSYDEPHDPYLCPKPYSDMYRDYRLPKSPNVWDTLADKPEHHRIWAGRDLHREADALAIRAPDFLGCNAFVDAEIGRVLEAVDRLAPGCLVLYTADHGAMLHSHRLGGKGPAMYEEITAVPLLARWPGRAPAGAVSPALVSHADLTPTILQALNLPVPKAVEGLGQLALLERPDRPIRSEIFMEFGRYETDHDGFGGFQPVRACCDGRYKLVINLLTSDELYDLQADPYEMVNRINDPGLTPVRDALHDRLLAWMNDTRDPFRGYYWERRPWRAGARPATWDYTLMTRQRENEEYEPRQLDYGTGLEMEAAVRIKGQATEEKPSGTKQNTGYMKPAMPLPFRILASTILALLAAHPLPTPAGAAEAQPEFPPLRGFDARVREAFERERGQPLVRAKKRPPLQPGRGNYLRPYSYSIVDYAARCLVLNEQLAEANAALIENARGYLERLEDLDDRDSFYWHTDMLCRFIEDYGANGRKAPGRLTEETERIMMEAMWTYVSRRTSLAEAETAESQTWHITGSENHHLQHILLAWHFARLARTRPEYRDRPYADGATAESHYAAWTEYLKRYALERARKGLFVEVGSDGYNTVGMKGFYNIYDYADDPELKRRAGCLLNLWWAVWAQYQLDGVQGGGRARIYQTGGDRLGTHSNMRELAWFYFAIGEPARPGCPLLSALLSDYRPPPVIVDLAGDAAGRGCYEACQRPLGLAEPDHNSPPTYRLRTDGGGILRYAWCTPDFILGTSMTEALPWTNWTAISSQNRWHGAIFAGHPNARIVPQCRAHDDRTLLNAQWSAQRHGSLICQKLRTHKGGREMRVWFSEAGLSNRIEEAGWIFTEAPRAFAGVRVVTGGSDWSAPETGWIPGQWLVLRDEWSPVILEVARQSDFPDFAAFRQAVADLPVAFTNQVLSYRGLAGDAFIFHAGQSEPPLINGKTPAYAGPAFESPFVAGDWDAGIVTLRKGNRTLVLDFHTPADLTGP